jgi:hypothetical protein
MHCQQKGRENVSESGYTVGDLYLKEFSAGFNLEMLIDSSAKIFISFKLLLSC